jgi:uncharacterized protein (DUF1501 family)
MHSRRDVLSVGLKGLGMIALGSSVPAFVPRLAFARQESGTPVRNDNILVVVQLSGGNDGLNTVVPLGLDAYQKGRGALALADKVHKLTDAFGLNPGMTAFKRLFDEGQLAVVHGCGYPRPNRSHFESMHIWHTCDPTCASQSGWLGHYLDHMRRGTTAHALRAVNIGGELPQALVSEAAPAPSIRNLGDFQFRFDPDSQFDTDLERQIVADLQQTHVDSPNPALKFLARQSMNAIVSADEIRQKSKDYKPDANYPQNLLNNVAESIAAFLDDLKVKGLDQNVTVMCFSEFGRRIRPNESQGTDHGAAGPMFLVGPKVVPGLHGNHPSLDEPELDDGDLRHTTDFRSVYATLLTKWLNVDAKQVLGADYGALQLM